MFMKINSAARPHPASELKEFNFVHFLREIDRWKTRTAANELNRHFVRQLTRDQIASAH